MDFLKFKSIKDNLLKENILLKSVIVVEGVLIASLAFTLISNSNSQRTVFLPPQATYQEFWVSGDQVSKSYLENVSSFVAYNLLNISPDNANSLLSNLLPLVDSDSYYKVKEELTKMHNHILSNQISRTFYAGTVQIVGNNKLILGGVIKDAISQKIVKSENVNLVIEYKIKFGRFYITNLGLEKK